MPLFEKVTSRFSLQYDNSIDVYLLVEQLEGINRAKKTLTLSQ